MGATTVATWFGPSDQPLFGVLHYPQNLTLRGAVIICPPLGQEATLAQAALRTLAVRLADAGYLALRFDYLGTGDSSGPSVDPTAVAGWLHSIRHAYAHVQSIGIRSISLVGLRGGALLAGNATQLLGPLTAVAWWDPIVSGRRLIRREQSLYRVSVPSAPPPGADSELVDGIGITFDPQMRDDLEELTLRPAAGSPFRTAVFQPSGIMTGGVPDGLLTADGVETIVIPNAFDDGPTDINFFPGRLPVAAIEKIAAWFGHLDDTTTQTLDAPPPVRLEAILAADDGTAVRETLINITRTPKHGSLNGIRSEPFLQPTNERPIAIILNVSVVGRTGPARGWVTVARELAARGTTAIRYDRYGLGESIDDRIGYEARDYDADVLSDLTSVATYASPQDPSHIRLAGLCSGAWAASVAAAQIHPREVILINQNRWTARPAGYADARNIDWIEPPSSNAALSPRRTKAIELLKTVFRTMPDWVWVLAGRLGLIDLPEQIFAHIPNGSVKITLMFSDDDAARFNRLAGSRSVRRKRATSEVDVVPIPDADHAMIARPGRDRILAELVDRLGAESNLQTAP